MKVGKFKKKSEINKLKFLLKTRLYCPDLNPINTKNALLRKSSYFVLDTGKQFYYIVSTKVVVLDPLLKIITGKRNEKE